MSYSALYRPPQEVIDKFKSRRADFLDDEINEVKDKILILVLNPTESHTQTDIPTDDLTRTRTDIKFYLNELKNLLREQYRHDRYEDYNYEEEGCEEKGDVCFQGRDCIEPHYNKDKEDEFINNMISNMLVLAHAVSTPDFFSYREDFFEKVNVIKDEISKFEECILDYIKQELLVEWKQYLVPDDEIDDEEDAEQTAEDENTSLGRYLKQF